VQADFRLTSANGPTVAAICRRLDALPLALELAAPWIKMLTAEDLLRRLEQDVLFSKVGPLDLPERQQTISVTVAWSYDLLGPNERRAFRRFGVMPGRFSIEAAAAVLAGRERASARSGEALGVAASFIDKSLLLRAETSEATRPQYQMLETVRAYAALELTAAGERDDALDGLARYCTDEASLAAEGLVGPAQAEWLDRVRDDLENYRCALTWLIECDRPTDACDIAWGLMFFWADPGASGRRPPMVRTDTEHAVASASGRVKSAGRSGRDVVHARRTWARTHLAHARPGACPQRRRPGSGRAG
jgi:predicted ATPase